MCYINIYKKLKELISKKAEFRRLQEKTIQAIITRQSLIVNIIAIRERKSLLFMLLAKSIGTKTTVVITPLVSLQNDLAGRCQKVGMPCMSWDSRKAKTQAHSPTQVVIVTPEAAVGETFGTFLNRLQGMY